MIRRPPRSTQSRSSAASDVYKRQVLEKITPVGALLKNGSFLSLMAGSAHVAGCDGRLPTTLKISICCAGWISHSTSLYAASMFLPWAGMVQNEPPQLPPGPGMSAMSHLPLVVGAVVLM